MSIITLITDFGTKDHFVAKIKGAIISDFPQASIVDISHQISPFNIMEAAYVIENSYLNNFFSVSKITCSLLVKSFF